jgi:hypothetical protein
LDQLKRILRLPEDADDSTLAQAVEELAEARMFGAVSSTDE